MKLILFSLVLVRYLAKYSFMLLQKNREVIWESILTKIQFLQCLIIMVLFQGSSQQKIINSFLVIKGIYKIQQFRCSFDKIFMRRALVRSVCIFVKEFQFKTGIWSKIAVQQNLWWREQWDKLKKQYEVTVQKLSKLLVTFKIRQKLEFGVKGWSQALNPSYPMTPEQRKRYRGYFLYSNSSKTNADAMYQILELLRQLRGRLEKQYANYSWAHKRYCVEYRRRVKRKNHPSEYEESDSDDSRNSDYDENEDSQYDEFGIGNYDMRKQRKQPGRRKATDTQDTRSKKKVRQNNLKILKRIEKDGRIKKDRRVIIIDADQLNHSGSKNKRRQVNPSIQGSNVDIEDNYEQDYRQSSRNQFSEFNLSQISSDSVSSSSSSEDQMESQMESQQDSVQKHPIKQEQEIYHGQEDQQPSSRHQQYL